MKTIDLSHTIHSEILTFPGTQPPRFEQATTYEEHGFVEKIVTMYTHTGTHIDVPSHILENGLTVDKFDVGNFIGKARVIDVTNIPSNIIDINDLKEYETWLMEIDYLILKTGWSKYWGDNKYFNDFPTLSVETAEWLLQFKLKGIGIDAIAVDPVEDKNFTVHRVLFRENLIIIENMTNLNEVDSSLFTLSCLPLKLKDADGSPVRAIAMFL